MSEQESSGTIAAFRGRPGLADGSVSDVTLPMDGPIAIVLHHEALQPSEDALKSQQFATLVSRKVFAALGAGAIIDREKIAREVLRDYCSVKLTKARARVPCAVARRAPSRAC